MTEEKIEGGCILIARNILNSEIWRKPPAYLKIFMYILLKVNHKDGLFPRGTNFFNFSDEKIDGVSRAQVDHFFRWAKSEKVQILATEKTTRGVVVKLNNYELYQDLENYYVRNTLRNNCETTAKQLRNRCDTINNNEIMKECNKNNKDILKNIFSLEEYSHLDTQWYELINQWLNYKKSRNQSYKNTESIKAFINKLLSLSGNNYSKAKQIIETSLANNWSGIFALKNENKEVLNYYDTPYNPMG